MSTEKIEQTNDYKVFSSWLDKVFQQGLPKEIEAFNFNLYEGFGTYSIQLVGCDNFDEDDVDWACSNYFTTGENICRIERTENIEYWENGLSYMTELVEQYLVEGRYAKTLKSVSAVGIGFVDGDVNMIYRSLLE
jgi:hypothetical protein